MANNVTKFIIEKMEVASRIEGINVYQDQSFLEVVSELAAQYKEENPMINLSAIQNYVQQEGLLFLGEEKELDTDIIVEEAIKEYQTALQEDKENTDAIYFILEDIGAKYNLSESDFELICYTTYQKLKL
jgi:hypothetical protein